MKGWLISVTLMLATSPAAAQWSSEGSATKPGFSFPPDRPARILLFRPDVKVGAQTTAGMNEPSAEWTATARDHIAHALDAAQLAQGNTVVPMPELGGTDAALLADYRALFRTVANAAIEHRLFPGARLPTRKAAFDWTLGPGIERLGAAGGGDYGLFLYTYDSYGSTGRKAAQVVGLLLGVGMTAGVHVGYAGLVDLRTGDLVWLSADVAMGGDVREPEGATKRVAQLLAGFPGRVVPSR
ncbi:hypothetical protein SAMN06297144_2338 [Sphingomonas guangdongensis]|uniref:DUF4136 domain-containing protein n=2 Tax=Sphingomonas guangdongensis TaxID=1141890 RepID=A0A285R052_9SPHN|nr:hypothetical protein SAMN06297144_2338 [Sphingomonas guangdongensis]